MNKRYRNGFSLVLAANFRPARCNVESIRPDENSSIKYTQHNITFNVEN